MSSSLLVLVLWSTVLLSERSRLLAMVNAKAAYLPDCTATTDGGRCDRIHGHEGCLTRVSEVRSKKYVAMHLKLGTCPLQCMDSNF